MSDVNDFMKRVDEINHMNSNALSPSDIDKVIASVRQYMKRPRERAKEEVEDLATVLEIAPPKPATTFRLKLS